MTISDHSRRFLKDASLLAWECSIAFDELMHIVGCEIVVAALQKFHGNQCAAARSLSMHRNTLARWANQAKYLGMKVPKWAGPPPRKPVQSVIPEQLVERAEER